MDLPTFSVTSKKFLTRLIERRFRARHSLARRSEETPSDSVRPTPRMRFCSKFLAPLLAFVRRQLKNARKIVISRRLQHDIDPWCYSEEWNVHSICITQCKLLLTPSIKLNKAGFCKMKIVSDQMENSWRLGITRLKYALLHEHKQNAVFLACSNFDSPFCSSFWVLW